MAKVIEPFRDRDTWAAHATGDEYRGKPERVAELVALGLVEAEGPADKSRPRSRGASKGQGE